MFRLALLLLSIQLAACGGDTYDPHSDNHGYGYQTTEQGPRGLRLRYESPQTAIDPAAWEAAYDEVQRCAGLSAPIPFVIILPNLPGGNAGLSLENPALILIQDRVSLDYVFRHESIHHLCYYNSGDSSCAQFSPQASQDPNHRSELFAACTYCESGACLSTF